VTLRLASLDKRIAALSIALFSTCPRPRWTAEYVLDHTGYVVVDM
jgi:hypothetical protein